MDFHQRNLGFKIASYHARYTCTASSLGDSSLRHPDDTEAAAGRKRLLQAATATPYIGCYLGPVRASHVTVWPVWHHP